MPEDSSPILSHVYPNGLTLVAQPIASLQSAAFTLLVPAGCALDPDNRAGLATFTNCSHKPRPGSEPRVSIHRAAGYDQRLYDVIRRILAEHRVEVRGKRVVLKPNLVEFEHGSPINTNPVLVHAALEAFRALGAADVRIAEGPGHRRATLDLAEGAGYFTAVPGFDNIFTDLNLDECSPVKLKAPQSLLKELFLPHTVLGADILVSLPKLKTHHWVGATLSMKNLFGMTPNTLYGQDAGSENAIGGRAPLHDPRGFEGGALLGARIGNFPIGVGYRIPRIVADICAARPIDLAIIDGITALQGGEGPWAVGENTLRLATPGLLIAGLNPVSTDAVGTAVMGLGDPRARQGSGAFKSCDNHLLLAEQKGLGTAELSRIEVRGLAIDKATYSYRS